MNVSHSVHPIRQPNLNDCWATAAAMVLRLDPAQGVDEVKRRVQSLVRLRPNGSIASDQLSALGRALHLVVDDVRSHSLTPTRLVRALRRSAAAAFGTYYFPGAPVAESTQMHVLLLYRLTGRDDNPMVSLVDPYTGRRISYLLAEFNEGVGSVDFLVHQ